MAFTCDDCHKEQTGRGMQANHFSFSHGRCEFCGEPAVCADCHCKPVKRETEDLSDLSRVRNDGNYGVGFKLTENKWYGWMRDGDEIKYHAMSGFFIADHRKDAETEQEAAMRLSRTILESFLSGIKTAPASSVI